MTMISLGLPMVAAGGVNWANWFAQQPWLLVFALSWENKIEGYRLEGKSTEQEYAQRFQPDIYENSLMRHRDRKDCCKQG